MEKKITLKNDCTTNEDSQAVLYPESLSVPHPLDNFTCISNIFKLESLKDYLWDKTVDIVYFPNKSKGSGTTPTQTALPLKLLAESEDLEGEVLVSITRYFSNMHKAIKDRLISKLFCTKERRERFQSLTNSLPFKRTIARSPTAQRYWKDVATDLEADKTWLKDHINGITPGPMKPQKMSLPRRCKKGQKVDASTFYHNGKKYRLGCCTLENVRKELTYPPNS